MPFGPWLSVWGYGKTKIFGSCLYSKWMSRSLSTAAVTRNENRCYRSPTRSAMAQMARHPSVHITDTTPAHTAATLRPDRHHTHGHQVAIVGWQLYEAYTLQPFVAISSCPGRPMSENYSLAHAPHVGACANLLGVAWQSMATARGVRDKSNASCSRFPTTPAGEGG